MVDGLSASLKALFYFAIFQAAGMAIFLKHSGGLLLPAERLWLRRTTVTVAVAAFLLCAAYSSFEAARMGGALSSLFDTDLQKLALSSSASTALSWRLAGLVLICASVLSRLRAGDGLALVGAGIAMTGFTQTGHTSAGPWHGLLGVLLWVHVMVVAFWVGALIPLYRAARSAGSALLVERFSRTAFILVPFVFIAGLALAALIIRTPERLLTPYGAVILLKACLFAVLMLLAAINKWRLGPRLGAGDATAGTELRRSVAAEFIIITLVLTLTALLTTFLSPEQ
jgi:copper resistance protein D